MARGRRDAQPPMAGSAATASDRRCWHSRRGRSLACRSSRFFVWQSFYDHAADFKTFFSAGYAVRHPEIPLYDLVALDENPFGEVFKLAPPAAVYLVPFSFGTVQQARLAWRIVLVAGDRGGVRRSWRGRVGLRLLGWPWLAGLAAWSVFGPLQIAVGEGQWDPIFLLLIAVATHGGRRRPDDGSPALAVARRRQHQAVPAAADRLLPGSTATGGRLAVTVAALATLLVARRAGRRAGRDDGVRDAGPAGQRRHDRVRRQPGARRRDRAVPGRPT